MSDTDSFIDEVTEELRRDQLYRNLRRYGWIGILAVVLLVGGAAYSEYRKAQDAAQAQAFGDAMLDALSPTESSARAEALAAIEAPSAEGGMVVGFLAAAEQAEAGQTEAAVQTLNDIAMAAETPAIYRQIAQFKALLLQAETRPAAELRGGFQSLAEAGGPLRLLAEEQIALIAVAEGDVEAAIAGYQAILSDAEVSPDLQQRALQVIVALGGEPELGGVPNAADLSGEGN